MSIEFENNSQICLLSKNRLKKKQYQGLRVELCFTTHIPCLHKALYIIYNMNMFNSLTGIITGKFPKQVFIDTNGVEWDLCVPDSNLDMLPPVGNEAKIYTYLQHTDQLMSLYGFASSDERSVFLDLLKVDGVGPKGAVKIMSAVSSSRLRGVLEKGDLEMLEKIPGVGKKTAGKMMLTLKGKLKISESAGDLVRVSAASPYADVVMSLASMGYDKKLVEQKVAQLVEILTNDSSFVGKGQKEREDILFRRAIVELA